MPLAIARGCSRPCVRSRTPWKALYPGSYIDLWPSTAIPSVAYVDTDCRAARYFADESLVAVELQGRNLAGAAHRSMRRAAPSSDGGTSTVFESPGIGLLGVPESPHRPVHQFAVTGNDLLLDWDPPT
jgi:hypothetical protein